MGREAAQASIKIGILVGVVSVAAAVLCPGQVDEAEEGWKLKFSGEPSLGMLCWHLGYVPCLKGASNMAQACGDILPLHWYCASRASCAGPGAVGLPTPLLCQHLRGHDLSHSAQNSL